MDKKLFSIVLTFHNMDNYLEETIESIINQDIGFKDNVQLILVDDNSDDSSMDIALKFEREFSQNILVLSQNETNISKARNMAKKHVAGEYVNFMESQDKLGPACLSKVDEIFCDSDLNIVGFPSPVLDASQGARRFEKVELSAYPESYLTTVISLFFKSEFIRDLEFDSRLISSRDIKFLSQAFLKDSRFFIINSKDYQFRQHNLFDEDLELEKDYYIKKLNFFIKDSIEYALDKYGEMPYFFKFMLVKSLLSLTRDKDTCNILDEDFEDFFNSFKSVLNEFENEEIIEICDNPSDSGFFIAVKNEDITVDNIRRNEPSDSLKLNFQKSNVTRTSGNCHIDDLSKRSIFLDFVNLRDGVLSFSGYLKTTFNRDELSISGIREYADGEVEVIRGTFFDYPTRSTSTMFGLDWEYVYNFDLIVPTKNEKDVSSIRLVVNLNHEDESASVDCPIVFRKYCNISYESHYYVKENRMVMFDGKFNVMPYSYLKMVRHEIPDLIKILRRHEAFFEQALFFRVMNLILFPFMRNKEIWIVIDRKDMADDNAEHFYKYALKQDDGIKKFFSIAADSPDYSRLEESYGNVLPFESIKHRFYYTFAKKIISSQGSEFYLNPFRFRNYNFTAGISNVDFYFLQHGIIKDNMSSWLRKYDRNPKLIVTSTQKEYESLFDEGYNYDEDVIQLLGLPRYDNLNNKGYRKQIVIMPSWRNYLVDEESLLQSEYFRRFNSLINNQRLIEHARIKGYDIIFKPHPELMEYCDLFDRNDYVQIDKLKKYQEIFNESAILITDYSSIFFDFSYLKKPLIYYQYGNDYHYDSENGYFQYETMGFGPVIKDEDELVDKLIEYMDNGSEMEDIYKKRVDDFFKYHDHNNSKRCYDWIHEH